MTTNPITQLRTDLAARFPERTNVIDGALAAVLAGPAEGVGVGQRVAGAGGHVRRGL